jgi:putative flippase GtrA
MLKTLREDWTATGKFNLPAEDFMLRTVRYIRRTDDSSPQRSSGWKRTVGSPGRKYGVFRIARFAVASSIGFLVAEVILALGVIVFYHTINVPSVAYSSPTILGSNVLAFGIGVTVAFIINEGVTVRGQNEERRKGRVNWFVRWCKYQLASLLGNVVIVGVQLALLATISLSPVFGNVVGAIVSYPVTYAVAMYFVWGIRPFRE